MTAVYKITPVKKVTASIHIPGSKSYTNRALLIAALAKGTSTLNNCLLSDDTKVMIEALKKCGVKIQHGNTQENNRGTTITVNGGEYHPSTSELYLENAGTATRFLTTFACLLDGDTTITGNERMKERPIKDLIDALHQLGVTIDSTNGCPPLTIHGGTFHGGKCTVSGSASSQYLSSLLLNAPAVSTDLTIDISGELVSKPYIDITLNIMKAFGVKVLNSEYKRFIVPEKSKYVPQNYTIEGDASSASYFFAAAAITGGEVTVHNINPNTAQGDLQIANALKDMGCTVEYGDNCVKVTGPENNQLQSISVDMNAMPDMAQTLAVVALFANGKTTIKNVANLKIKETDRIKATATELRKFGATVEEHEDGLTITPPQGGSQQLTACEVDTYNDHRMAMAFSVAGLVVPGVKIKDPMCVTKTFPTYWETFELLQSSSSQGDSNA